MSTDETIPRLLARRRREDGPVPALVSDERSITYAQLDEQSRTLAARLVAAGVTKADRVGLMMPNGIPWSTTAMAIMRVGAVLVPLSTLLRPPELLAQLRTAAVTHLLTVEHFRERSYLADLDAVADGVRELVDAGRRHPMLPSLRAAWADTRVPEAAVPESMVVAMEDVVRPADDMAILFTSGSRGAPKGVVHTHGNALRATAAGLAARCVSPGERLYIPMPFFWMGGFGGGLLTAVVAGATLLTESDPEPGRTIEFLQRQRVTLFRGWPDQAARIAAHPTFGDADLSSLRPGSLPAVLPLARRPAPGARPNLFGMTESFGPYCGDRLDTDMPTSKHGSCGRPFDGIEVRIADPGSGREMPAGTEGEILLRGPNMMRTICGRDRSELFTADGFYATRDLGRLDEDGYLWYSGRLDDMFKVKGATVYPTEVEAALRATPGVRSAFVTNVDGPDGHDRVGALVVSAEDPAQIAAKVRSRLSSFKVPTVWLVVDDPAVTPMSATGKVDKARLQQMLSTEGALDSSRTTKETPV
jgi:acyl-coenzyme A synthetase/AMP-(fatty) acid ligase